ncbi:MAG: protein kinase [Planctomycetes bacterium]|nr:protein kinase [Planctomycetota bacterium]
MSEQKLELLGQLAVQQKLVTADQLKLCLSEQAALRKTGRLVPLGQILVQRRFLTSDQIRRLLLNQKGVPADAPLVNGKYALVRKLGKGGAGEVYLARDTTLDRPVAVKVLREEMAQNRKSVERFLREARVLAKIRHPNVVGVHETGEYQGRPYFIMDFVDGTSLDGAMTPGAMSLRHKVEILQKVSGAVAELHRHGVVHRDLKPSNIIIDGKGNPILLDFGLAHDISRHTKLTVTGTILGTPFYMAPEQVEGKQVDARTDVYALGVLLYEMLTGHLPFRAENEFELYRQISTHEPPNPSTVESRVPRDLEIVCLKAMDKQPSVRYANAGEFADDLRRYLDGQPIQARPVSMPVRVWRRIKEHRIVAVAGASMLFVGLIVMVGLLISGGKKSSQVRRMLTHAEQAFQEARLDDAEKLYKQVEALDPDNQTAREGRAKLKERQKLVEARLNEAGRYAVTDPEEAERLYAAVLEMHVDNQAAKSGLRTARENKLARGRQMDLERFFDEVRGAIQKYESDVMYPPKDYLARDCARGLQDKIVAIRQRLERMEDKPRQAEARYLLGRIYILLGKTEAAREELDFAVEMAGAQGRYYFERGKLMLSRYRREYASATQDAKRKGLAESLKKLQDLRERALADFQKARELALGEWEKAIADAVIAYYKNNSKKALEICNSVTDHRDPVLLKLAGQMFLELSWNDPAKYADAERSFKKAADIWRSDPEARSGLADTCLQQVQNFDAKHLDLDLLERAIGEYRIALELQEALETPEPRVDLGRALLVRAERQMVMGLDATEYVEEARKHMMKAKEKAFGNPQVHFWLGISYLHGATNYIFRPGAGPKVDEAETEIDCAMNAFEQLLKLDPNDADGYQSRAVARGLRALVLMMRGRDPGGDLDRAQEDIQKALKLGLSSSALFEAKAVTHMWKFMYVLSRSPMEKLDEGMQELNRAIEACDQAVSNRHATDRARTVVFRATLKMVRGFFAFMKWDKELCVSSMQGAAADLREAGSVYKYASIAPEAFEHISKAMELHLDRKDAKAEYAKAREGLTKILSGVVPNDPHAHVLRMFALLLRGFANYSLERHAEAVADWEELCRHVPFFESLLGMWLADARKKAGKGG